MKALALKFSMVAVLLPLGHQPAAQCPTDSLVVCGVVTTSSTPSYSVLGCAFNGSGATYNLVAGQVSAGVGGGSGNVALTTEDIYTITSPGSIGPIAFVAQLAVRVGLVFRGIASAGIRSSDGTQDVAFGPAWNAIGVGFSYTLSLPMVHAVGEPFLLALSLRAASSYTPYPASSATATGILSFKLPPGYSVTSCQGYSSLPTSTKAFTWGRLKAIYR